MLAFTYRIFLLLLALAYCKCLNGQTVPYTWEWAEEAYTNNTEFAADAAVDPLSGDLVVVGEFTGDISAFYGTNFIGALGGGFVARYNSAGALLWAFKIGENDNDRCKGVTIDNAGNIYVTGYLTIDCDFHGNSPGPNVHTATGGRDVFVAKYTSAGMYVWAKIGGGSNDDEGLAVAVAGSNVYVTGYYHNAATFGPLITFSGVNNDNVFICAYNATTGNELWLADAGTTNDGYGYDVIADSNNVYITGTFKGNITFYNAAGAPVASPAAAGNDEGFVASYSSVGAFNWVTQVTGGGPNTCKSVTLFGGNIYVTGAIDNSTTFTGYSSNPVIPTGSNLDFYLAQLSSVTGTTQWVRCEPGTGADEGMQVATDGVTIFACGSFEGTATYGSLPSFISSGNKDIFVINYTATGTLNWIQVAGGIDEDLPHGIACANSSEVYTCGQYKDEPTFGSFTLFNESTINIFVAKLSCSPITNNNISAPQTICTGQTPLPLTGSLPTGGSTPYVYSWEESPDNFTWGPASGTNNTQNYSPPALTSNMYYRRRVTSSGGCVNFSYSASVLITVDPLPTVAAAGVDQTLCSSSTSLLGNTPSTGNGTWTLISGSGTITTPSSPTTGITAMSPGANIFQWTITNGTCPSSSDQVSINVDPIPTTAVAGVDQTICSSSTSLLGNTPTTGTGTWTLVAGSGTITTPSSPTSGITAMSPGANIFQWTITSGTCPSSSDQVTINVDPLPTTAAAGVDQTLCASSTSLLGNTPTTGNGTWTLVSGSGTITTPSSPTSGITAMSPGANIFQWTITSGTCPSSSDQVTINVDPVPTTAAAGVDQTICSSSTSLLGNTPSTGNGIWTLVSGSGTITTPSSPTSGITAMSSGANIFQWTITSGTCPSSSDQVTINVDPLPTTASAGVDQTICSSSTSLLGNTPTNGNGTWSFVSGSGTITTPSSPTSGITAMSPGANIFQWTITSGTCPSSSDQVTVNVDPLPTTAAAGVDQTLCASSTSLLGNTPTTGNGIWTLVSGSGTITTPSSPTSGITAMSSGANIFQWTITSGTCPSSSDQVTINVDPLPTTAAAGVDQTLCASSTSLLGNTPTTGNGTWTFVSGSGTITTPSSPTSGITAMSPGANIFQWTITSGTCPSSADTVVINIDAVPTVANAGTDQTLCSSSAAFAANAALVGNGMWTLLTGTGTPTTPTFEGSAVTALSVGANFFQWEISNGTCPASLDTVNINVDAMPTVASAGPDQTLCSSSTTLAGNPALVGNATWTLLSGSGTITTPTLETSGVTAMTPGANVFVWMISNGTCPSSTDTVTVNVDSIPTVANAGPDQTLCSSSVTLAGNPAISGNGLWSLLSGTGSLTTPTVAACGITAMSPGANAFQWVISNGTCPSSADTVIINVDAMPTVASAAGDQTLCSSVAAFVANTAVTGNGIWTLVSGTGTITSPNLATSAVTGLSVGANIFSWTISNGTCPSSVDTVIINVDAMPTLANAGPDQAVCTSYSAMQGNIANVGTGTWSLLSGSGIVTTPASETSAVTAMTPGINIFQWRINNGTCPSSMDTVIINVENPPTIADAGPDQTVDHPFFTLQGNAPVYGTGAWEIVSGSITLSDPTNPNCSVGDMAPGVYVFRWVISGTVCDSTSDEVTITVSEFLIPNGFSPNQDGINDYFVIPGVGYWENFNVSIYNRWGQLVYHNANYQNDWNGQSQNGEVLVDDTYYYTVEIPAVNKYSGFVVIKRE